MLRVETRDRLQPHAGDLFVEPQGLEPRSGFGQLTREGAKGVTLTSS
jgi:hypothetical protein